MRSPSLLSTPSPRPRARGRFEAHHWWLLLLITALGGVLRWWHLGQWSFWVDEAFTWRDATIRFDGESGFLHTDRALYPLAFLTVRGLLTLGMSHGTEGWLRLPFAIVGVLTVPLLALCGRRLVGPAPALLAALLLAIDPWHVFWSQNARGYAFVVAAATIAANRAYAYVQHERLRDLLATVLAMAFGVLSHGAAWLLTIGFVGLLLTRFLPDGRPTRRRLYAFGLAFAVAVPWLVGEFSPFRGFLRSKGDPSLLHFVETTAYYFRPVVLLAAIAGLWAARSLLDRSRVLVLTCYCALPFLLLGIISAELVKVTARYSICAMPVVLWLASLGAVEVTTRLRRAWPAMRPLPWLLTAALPLVMIADKVEGMVLYHTVQYGQRARWREACEFVRQRAEQAGGNGMRIVSINEPTVLYYLRPRHWLNEQPDPHATTEVIALDGDTARSGISPDKQKLHEPGADNHVDWQLRTAAQQGRYVAFLVTLPELIEKDPDGSLRRAIEQRCHIVQHLPCWVGPKDESIYVYEPNTP